MELSDGQFEHLVALLAEGRVAVTTAKNELMTEVERVRREIREEIRLRDQLLVGQLTAIEEDMGKVQGALRAHAEEFGRMHQTLEGVVQLGKSSFDICQSLQQHVHKDQSGRDVTGQESQRPQ